MPNQYSHTPTEERFWASVNKTETCWLWTGCDNGHGYGQFTFNGKNYRAHIFLNGKAPYGLQWDHLCRVRRCVNPAHLEAVTSAENTRRGLSGKRYRIRSHCKNGHLFNEANTYMRGNDRQCRQCRSLRNQAWRRRQKADRYPAAKAEGE